MIRHHPTGAGRSRARDQRLAALERRLRRETARRRAAEHSLRTLQQGLRKFLDAVPVAVAIYMDNRFLFSNRAHSRLMGAHDSAQLVGRPVLDIIDPEFHEIFRQRARQVRDQGAEVPLIAYVCRRLDGEPVFVETIAIPFSYNGRAAVMGVAIDVSRRKRDEKKLKMQRQQLIRAEKMVLLGKLASGVAHEINNPNNFIQLNASLLANIWRDAQPLIDRAMEEGGRTSLGGLSIEEIREKIPNLARDILEGANRITHIVKELKDFTRPDLPDAAGDVDPNQVIGAALKLLDNVIRKSTARFSLDLAPDLPAIKGNFHRLERVMINLLMNSCQALDDTSRGLGVASRFEPETGRVVIEVWDQGAGIAAGDLEYVTDPFFTTKRDKGGSGLGLSVSSTIVADFGGSMKFFSEPGQGTLVRLSFPAAGGDLPHG